MSRYGGSRGYRIADEPQPGALARHVVDPFWPLLAFMVSGAWFGTLWFGFNAFALGSASKKRELIALALGLCSAAVVLWGIVTLNDGGVLALRPAQYALISLPVIKLGFAYLVHRMQSRSFELFSHFGGEPKNGAALLFGSMIAGNWLMVSLDSRLFELILR